MLVEQGASSNSGKLNLPDLLGFAFVSLRMTIPKGAPQSPTAQERTKMTLFEAGCAVNTLRNKQGNSPWPPVPAHRLGAGSDDGRSGDGRHRSGHAEASVGDGPTPSRLDLRALAA